MKFSRLTCIGPRQICQRIIPSFRILVLCIAIGPAVCAQNRALARAAGESNLSDPPKRQRQIIPDLKLELIWVAPGLFTMGSPPDEPSRNKAEGPQTQVTLSRGFWLGKTEVTQEQYEAIAGENPSEFKTVGKTGPVECVSWIKAMAFCEKLNERERSAGRLPEGYAYTLPTEAQWEYACRAGTTGPYPAEPDAMSWHAGNSGGSTHPVSSKRPNPWGFYDMSGNVMEWTLDWYGDYRGGSVTDPQGPRRGYYRTGRGGSWRVDDDVGRSAARSGASAARQDYTIGFRLALSAVHPDLKSK